MKLTVMASGVGGRRAAPYVRRKLRAARRLVRSAVGELSVALVGEAVMADLHHRYSGVGGATDVLTFELEHDAKGRVTAGEVVVCVAVARRRAGRRASEAAVAREVLLYALHGLLHLSGFDDRDRRGYERMHAMEDWILTRLGVGRVFAAPGEGGRRRNRGAGR